MSNMDKLRAAVSKAKATGGTDREDDVFYYPQRDAAGNGSAVIRFLPAENEDDAPFVKIYAHGFKGPTNKWLIEPCPTTIEQDCPVCTANSALWNTGLKEDQELVRTRKRKVSYISRIVVVEDKKTTSNEGNVFLFKYGTRIFDKIADKLSPEFDDDDACNIFDLEEGANFKLKIRKVDGQTNYDKSEFESTSVCEVDVEKQYTADNSIQKFLEPSKFKSAEKLAERLNMVLGNTDRVKPKAEKIVEDEESKPVKPAASKRTEVKVPVDDEDDIMAMVKSLATDD